MAFTAKMDTVRITLPSIYIDKNQNCVIIRNRKILHQKEKVTLNKKNVVHKTFMIFFAEIVKTKLLIKKS